MAEERHWTHGQYVEHYKQLEVENAELKKDKSHLEDVESDLNNTLSFAQRGVDIWKEKAEQLQAEVEQLKRQFDCLSELVILHNPETWEYYLEDIKQALKGKVK